MDKISFEETEKFCQEHGIHPGLRIEDKTAGPSVFGWISDLGFMICHTLGEPNIQSSWAMTPEVFARHYLDCGAQAGEERST